MCTASRFRLVISSVLVAVLIGSPAFARAADPAPAPALSEAEDPTPWRKLAIPLALVGSGVGLVAGVGFLMVSGERTDAFNAHADRSCNIDKPGRGGPTCARLYDQAQSASAWGRVGLGAAAAFALTALVLKLTEPDAASPAARGPGIMARHHVVCAPGAGFSAACAFTF